MWYVKLTRAWKSCIARLFRRKGEGDTAAAMDAFYSALKDLGPGDVAIDCGANVGKFTLALAQTGAQVYAFEPDPVAFARLKDNLAKYPNAQLFNKAVSNHSGIDRLYLHKARGLDPIGKSKASSLLATKSNIDMASYVDVEAVSLADFVRGIGEVALLKMDIEGHEIEVLNDLFDRQEIYKVKAMFVELHDRKNPQLKVATDMLRARIQQAGINADLAWH